MKYYVYENWQAEGHKAKIHFANCSFCKNGKGIHPNAGEDNGQWHGPFDTFQVAVNAANSTGGRISKCKFCNPK